MVDYQNGVDPSAAPVGGDAAGEAKQGFLSTTTGKLIVGGVALVLVLGAIGAAVFFFVIGGALDGAVEDAVNPPTLGTVPASAEATQPPVDPAEQSLASTFTFRNVFAPTVAKSFAVPETASTDTSGSTSTDVPADTLYLQSIITEDGQPKAVFIWNNQTYTVGEGEQVSTSPWKVLQINTDSVLMLYGDSQVTLSVGQGIAK